MSGQRKNSRNSNRRTPPARKKSNNSGSNKFIPGLFIGFILGIIATSVVDFSSLGESAEQLVAERPTAKQPKNSNTEQPPKPRFDFYTLLQESEVIVSEDETPVLNEPLELPKEKPKATAPQSSEIYLLQVGSFKSQSDADSLRVNLLLLNLQAYIEKVSPRPGETWHRVLVGPLDSRSQVANAKSKLATNKIDSLLLKRKR